METKSEKDKIKELKKIIRNSETRCKMQQNVIHALQAELTETKLLLNFITDER